MVRITSTVCAAALTMAALTASAKSPAYVTPEEAAEHPDFAFQGEYRGETEVDGDQRAVAVQVVALGEGKFVAIPIVGGLPGDTEQLNYRNAKHGQRDGDKVLFDKSDDQAVLTGGVLKIPDGQGGQIAMQKVERKSPTLGAKPPEGALVLFDGSDASLEHWTNGKATDGLLHEGARTKQNFGDFTMHIEFRYPFKPDAEPSSQDRGNSGVYIHNRYETQLLDSFGLHYFHLPEDQWKAKFEQDFGFAQKSDRKQWGGCFYKFKVADVNMNYPPLVWQTYDLDFTAARFDPAGNKSANARITVKHNGVIIHNDVELPRGTGVGGSRPEIPEGPIDLQGHGNPVRFRNIWIVPR